MSKRKVLPARSLKGSLTVPGDKSISHRYAILAALADGRSRITNYAPGDDCQRTLRCLKALGTEIEADATPPADDPAAAGPCVSIAGAGLCGLRPSANVLDAGNSGTTMRLLAGVLAGQPFPATLTGDASLRSRPMRRVIEPLAQMGAQIRARDAEFPPLEIHGGELRAIDYTLPVPSAQVKSAVLLAGLYASGVTSVSEPIPTRDHLENALAEFGADVSRDARTVRVAGQPRLRPGSFTVPGDLSSATFFLAAALVLPDSELVIRQVGLNPTRAAVLDFLASAGAPISLTSVEMRHGELVGDVAIRYAALAGGVVRGPMVAAMIDELPMLAALGPYTEQGIEIRDAGELRVKESDRIAALAANLREMGATVEEFPDGLRVAGRSAGHALRGAEIDPRSDHRIAMACVVAGLGAAGESILGDAECVAVSFPVFFELLDQVAVR